MTPKEIAILAAKARDSKKGEDIKVSASAHGLSRCIYGLV